jgi:hypothetical protein
MSRQETGIRCFRLVILPLICVALCAAATSIASGQVARGAETVSCGGGDATSLSYRAHDTIGQGPIGTVAEGGGMRAYDGFWLTLPNINVPVEGAFFAALTEAETVILRWTVGSLNEITGFHVYRATAEEGPFTRVNEDVLPPQSPGSYEDATVWPETAFWYEVRAVFGDGSEDVVGGYSAMVTTGGRLALRLYPAYPNPSRGGTMLRFDVPSHAGDVFLDVYSADGRRVRSLVSGPWDRGRHELVWDGQDKSGRTAASGVYFVRLVVDGESEARKVLVLH